MWSTKWDNLQIFTNRIRKSLEVKQMETTLNITLSSSSTLFLDVKSSSSYELQIKAETDYIGSISQEVRSLAPRQQVS